MAEKSGLEIIREKYKGQEGYSSREKAYEAFEKTDKRLDLSDREYKNDQDKLRRVSQAPKSGSGYSIGDIHAEMAEIELNLAELADYYGKLNVNFGNLIGKQGIYGFDDILKYHLISRIPMIGGGNKQRRDIRINAARAKGESLEVLVGKMGEVLKDQYNEAQKARDKSQRLQVENISHIKKLDRSLIDRLANGYVGTADYTLAQEEVKKLDSELEEIDKVLTDYESKVQNTKTSGDVDSVKKYTNEMTEILEIKHGVLDGKLSADGLVSEIRRKMLESAEGVQSAKNATAASKVNYKAINALVDSMNELEIKYQHALHDFLPVFEIQAKVAGIGKQGLDMKKALLSTAAISQRLMEANAKLVTKLATETFELLQTDLYDPIRARETEIKIDEYMNELNRQKVEWTEATNRVTEIPNNAHYGSEV